jgi:thioredoxin 1
MEVDKSGVTLTDQTFQTLVLESPQPVLVAFWAVGCGPWQMLAPAIAALAEAFRGQVTVATLDVEAEPQTPERYGIQTLPAVLFFQEGKVVDARIGVVDRADLVATLHALTGTGQACPRETHTTSQGGKRGERMDPSPLALVSMARQREDGTYGSLDPVDADSLSEDLRVRCVEAIERYRAEHGTVPNSLVIKTTGQVIATSQSG